MRISLSVRQLDWRLPSWLRNIVLRLYSSCSAETPRAVVLLSLSVVHMHLTLLRIFVGAARVAVGYVLLQMLDWQLVVDTSADIYWGSMSCSCALFLCAKISIV